MGEPRAEVAGLYERAAAELEVAAQHARVPHDTCVRTRFLAAARTPGQRTDMN
jgi:hypothetical protein